MKQDQLPQEDHQLVAHAKQVLDHSVGVLDQTIAFRLQRARRAALAAGSASRWRWAWASGLAMATIAAFAMILWTRQPSLDPHHPPLLEDMELVLSFDNVELAEDFEFYHWLADADQTG